MTVKHKRKNALTHARPRSENRDRAAEKGPYDADADDAPAPSGRPNKWPLPSELGGPPPPQNPTAGLPAPVGFASVTPLTPSTYTLLPAPPYLAGGYFFGFCSQNPSPQRRRSRNELSFSDFWSDRPRRECQSPVWSNHTSYGRFLHSARIHVTDDELGLEPHNRKSASTHFKRHSQQLKLVCEVF